MYCRHCHYEISPILYRCIMINGKTHVYRGCPRCKRQTEPIWLKQSELSVPLEQIPIGKDNRGFSRENINKR